MTDSDSVQVPQMAWYGDRETGGDMVLIANTPEGMITYYLTGSFGRNTGRQVLASTP